MNSPSRDDTIAAVCTPAGRGLRAAVRVSGPRAFESVRSLCSPPPPRPPHLSYTPVALAPRLGSLPARLLFFEAPRSFTGEEVVEIHMPGSPELAGEVLSALLSAGCRAAGPGEFTRRAFLNGKLDISQAEAVARLAAAEGEAARREALSALVSPASERTAALREKVLDVLFRLEAGLDFPEEEIPPLPPEELEGEIRRLAAEAVDAAGSHRAGARLSRVVLAGPPNAGKSTLFNALAGASALVTPLPGTTTDALRAEVSFGGTAAEIWDTAGLEEEGGEAAERAAELACGADVVLLLVAPDVPTWEGAEGLPAGRVLPVFSKADLGPPPEEAAEEAARRWGRPQAVCALEGTGLAELRERIAERLESAGGSPLGALQAEALGRAAAELSEALRRAEAREPGEITAFHLREAAAALELLERRDLPDEVLDRIFSTFCIGK